MMYSKFKRLLFNQIGIVLGSCSSPRVCLDLPTSGRKVFNSLQFVFTITISAICPEDYKVKVNSWCADYHKFCGDLGRNCCNKRGVRKMKIIT